MQSLSTAYFLSLEPQQDLTNLIFTKSVLKLPIKYQDLDI